MGKVIGKPYRGEPDLRFDEGTKGKVISPMLQLSPSERIFSKENGSHEAELEYLCTTNSLIAYYWCR